MNANVNDLCLYTCRELIGSQNMNEFNICPQQYLKHRIVDETTEAFKWRSPRQNHSSSSQDVQTMVDHYINIAVSLLEKKPLFP